MTLLQDSDVGEKVRFDALPDVVLNFVQLPSDFLLEAELSKVVGPLQNAAPTVEYRVQKMSGFDSAEISNETYRRNAEKVIDAAKTLVDEKQVGPYTAEGSVASAESCVLPVRVLALACTSMAISLGVNEVDEKLKLAFSPESKLLPNQCVTNMGRAVVNGLLAMQKCDPSRPLRLALLTPYIDSLHKTVADFLCRELPADKLSIIAEDNLAIDRDHLVCRVSPNSVLNRCKKMVDGATAETPIDAVFICCSAFNATGGRPNSVEFLIKTEKQLGVPVLTSAQCLMWDGLHLGEQARQQLLKMKKDGTTAFEAKKIKEEIRDFGTLFQLDHPVYKQDRTL